MLESRWVDGVKHYLEENYQKQQFFLITATPKKEILDIVRKLELSKYFHEIVGHPVRKSEGMDDIIKRYNIDRKNAMMIGDAINDYKAATSNRITFILRKNEMNLELQKKLNCLMIEDFMNV